MPVIIAITCSPEQLKRPVLTAGKRPFAQQPTKNKRIIENGVMRIFGLMITVVVEFCQQSRFSDSLPMQFSAYSTFFIFVYELHFLGCILHTTNIELRPRLVSLGRFFCSILYLVHPQTPLIFYIAAAVSAKGGKIETTASPIITVLYLRAISDSVSTGVKLV